MNHARFCACLACYARRCVVFRGVVKETGQPAEVNLLELAVAIAAAGNTAQYIEDIQQAITRAEEIAWFRATRNELLSEPIQAPRLPPPVPVPHMLNSHEWSVLSRLYLGPLPGDETARLDVESGAYERFHKIQPGEVVLDAGAHVGYFTLHANLKRAKVIAIEPEDRNFSLLRNKGGHTQIRGLAGRQLGLDFLHTSRDGTSMHSCRFETLTSQVFPVPVITIDMLELERVDLIKIDVEGMEVDVLLGARETLKRCSPDLVIEVHGTEGKNVLPVLREAGYGFIRTARLLTDEPDEELRDEGIWWAHREAP